MNLSHSAQWHSFIMTRTELIFCVGDGDSANMGWLVTQYFIDLEARDQIHESDPQSGMR